MSKRVWSAIYHVNLVLLVILLISMLMEIKGVEARHLALAAVAIALSILVSYKLKSDDAATFDYARMLDSPESENFKKKGIATSPTNSTSAFTLEIVGVVTGIAAAEIDGEMKVNLNLSPWRVKGKVVHSKDLTIRLPKPISRKEYDRLVSNFAGDDVIAEFKTGEVTDDDIYDGKLATLLELVSAGVYDSELAAISKERFTPVSIELGGASVKFLMDDEEGIFAGMVQWLGKDIRLLLDTDKSFQLQAYIGNARSLLVDAKSIDLKVREKVYELWMEEKHQLPNPEGSVDTRDMILSRLFLRQIHLLDGGELIFYFAPDEIFAEKEVVVYGSLEEGPVEAELY